VTWWKYKMKMKMKKKKKKKKSMSLYTSDARLEPIWWCYVLNGVRVSKVRN